jgi:hypothetical protein
VPTSSTSAFGNQRFQLQATVANFGATPRTATILRNTGNDTQSKQTRLTTLTLPAHSVSVADLPSASDPAAGNSSVVIQTDGVPGEVLSHLQALPATAEESTSLTLPGKDQGQIENGGEHPWTLSEAVSSTVLLFNPDAERAASVQLTAYTGEARWTQQVSVPASATVAFSLDDLLHQQ